MDNSLLGVAGIGAPIGLSKSPIQELNNVAKGFAGVLVNAHCGSQYSQTHLVGSSLRVKQ